MSDADPTRVEQYIGSYDRVKLAVAFDYDEQKINRLRALEWEEHHTDTDDSYEFADGETHYTWTLDRSSKSLRYLRETVGLGIPPTDEIAWNVSVYPTAPGDDPRDCAACGEHAVLGDKGLAATNMHNSPEYEVLESELTDAEQVCTACGQFFEYLVRDDEADASPTHVTASMEAHEVM